MDTKGTSSKNSHDAVKNCLLAVGANLPSHLGGAERTVRVAFEMISQEPLAILGRSRLFSTPAYPKDSGPDFVNAALEISTTLGADELMGRLHDIEARAGRQRQHRWEARVLDIDMLSYGTAVLPDRTTYDRWLNLGALECATEVPDQLIVPHPRLHERGFVLVPLMDIAPDWVHPVSGATVRQMHGGLTPGELAGIRVL